MQRVDNKKDRSKCREVRGKLLNIRFAKELPSFIMGKYLEKFRSYHMNIRFCVLFVLVLALSSGCVAEKVALKKPALFASLEDYKSGPKGGVDLVWSTNRIRDAETLKTTLQKYDSLILDQTWLVVDKESARNLDDEQILATSRHMLNELKARLGQGFKLVDTPTENTLRLSVAMTNIETSLPILAVTSRLLPVGSTASTVSKIAIGEHVNTGRVTVELLVSDARSREPLVAVIDKQFDHQNLGTMIESPDAAKAPISLWADRLWITLRDWNWRKSRTANF